MAGKRCGTPCIGGLRITVWDVLGQSASGKIHEELLQKFPFLTEEDIGPCLGLPPTATETGNQHREQLRSAPAGSVSGSGAAGLPLDLLRRAQRQEILRTFYRLLEPLQQNLEVFTPLHKINVRRIDHQQIRRRIPKEEMFIRPRHFLNVLG
jgi:hypothetical protein